MGENKGNFFYFFILLGQEGWMEGFFFVILSVVKFIFDG